MKTNLEIAKAYTDACDARDFAKAKSYLHPDYTLRDPMMHFDSAEEMMQFMENCPFDGRIENVACVAAEGDTVVMTMDCVMTKPVAYQIHMCDVLTLRDGKVVSEETFYDTASIPKEAMELGMQGLKKKPSRAA